MKTVENRFIEDKKVWTLGEAENHYQKNYPEGETEIMYLVSSKNNWHEDIYLSISKSYDEATKVDERDYRRFVNAQGNDVNWDLEDDNENQISFYLSDDEDIELLIEKIDEYEGLFASTIKEIFYEDEYEEFSLGGNGHIVDNLIFNIPKKEVKSRIIEKFLPKFSNELFLVDGRFVMQKPDFDGEFISYEELTKLVRNLEIDSSQSYYDWWDKNEPEHIPRNPDIIYANPDKNHKSYDELSNKWEKRINNIQISGDYITLDEVTSEFISDAIYAHRFLLKRSFSELRERIVENGFYTNLFELQFDNIAYIYSSFEEKGMIESCNDLVVHVYHIYNEVTK
ncbi:hypothetical protein OKW21_006066 [Catalinimonas alkaloidigena]|uniref:hypothetical protein n=1 Tax=Catalinimonas alkaloidigena TaxID=1075417 RepID=UPI002405C735|nr:hypothetical protein [Catalinimonas alkaloidigena]MDF9800803.1 hypothetical protein [Catalinimonas alkaloidigena]